MGEPASRSITHFITPIYMMPHNPHNIIFEVEGQEGGGTTRGAMELEIDASI